jgi:hypothetical protein
MARIPYLSSSVIVSALALAACSDKRLTLSHVDAGSPSTGGATSGGGQGGSGSSATGGASAAGAGGASTGAGAGGTSVSAGGTGAAVSATGGAGGVGGSAGSSGISWDGGSTGSRDGAASDVRAKDAPYGIDLPGDRPPNFGEFSSLMTGVWLVGWSGGQNHFSWVRLSGTGGGSAEFLSGSDIKFNAPYWNCNGKGDWFVTAAPLSLLMHPPASCPPTTTNYVTFERFESPIGSPPGSILTATPRSMTGVVAGVWYKYPDGQCNQDMSSCTDPFAN